MPGPSLRPLLQREHVAPLALTASGAGFFLSTIIASLGLSFTERFIRSCRRGGITGSSHLLQLHYHDRASLLAGKLHAVLHAKGRDFFDLLQRPRLVITQSHAAQPCACANRRRGPTLTDENWCAVLHERLQNVSWLGVVDDVRPFLEPSVSADLLTRENLLRALEGRGGRHERSL